MKNIFNGRKFILTSSEENKYGAAKANNSKDTYLATAVTFIVIGALYLIDKLIHFSSIGLPWVMNKDNMLLYASICFLIFKRDKSIGFVFAWALASDEYRFGHRVLIGFVIRISVAIDISHHRNRFILVCKTIRE